MLGDLRIIGALGTWEKLKNSSGRFDCATSSSSGGNAQLYSMKFNSERWLNIVFDTKFSLLYGEITSRGTLWPSPTKP
jgi:hypothetical protein